MKSKISEGEEIWSCIVVNKDCPLDPRKLNDLAMKIRDAVRHADAHGFNEDQEREVVREREGLGGIRPLPLQAPLKKLDIWGRENKPLR